MSKERLLKRFLSYVQIDTQSDDNSTTAPSTNKQFELLHLLERELHQLGLEDIRLSSQGVLMASLPGNESAPRIGFLAHVDTAPDASGTAVKPIVHNNYNGKNITLPGNNDVIKVTEYPNLKKVKGHTIITSDGTTLLGADDKAGVAIIMELLTRLKESKTIKHGTIKVAFTPDEEIGRGVDNFDVRAFGADYAYTIDGSELGEIENATFNATGVTVNVTGKNIHPGYAKNKMINAIRVLSYFLSQLPLGLSPEKTEKLQGFLHPHQIQGDVASASAKILLRDFELSGIKEKIKLLKEISQKTKLKFPGSKIDLEIKEQYRNMKYPLQKVPQVVDFAIAAMKKAQIKPLLKAIRGGTDGARLSFMGLPTPNIFAGGQNFHSTREWASLEWMDKSVETLTELCQEWTNAAR